MNILNKFPSLSVIANPSLFVILTPYQVRGKNLIISLRVNSVKPCPEQTEGTHEIASTWGKYYQKPAAGESRTAETEQTGLWSWCSFKLTPKGMTKDLTILQSHCKIFARGLQESTKKHRSHSFHNFLQLIQGYISSKASRRYPLTDQISSVPASFIDRVLW